MTSSLRLYALDYNKARTYLLATLFVIGNLLVPQLFHLVPNGGAVWLPIYFFTLVGAYKYGWKMGLLVALFSPMLNCLLFGMPAVAALGAITLKSVVLAFAAGIFASRFHKAALWQLLVVVLSYQVVGTLGEWLMVGDFFAAVQDFRMGIPGMLLQVVGGWLVINKLIRA